MNPERSFWLFDLALVALEYILTPMSVVVRGTLEALPCYREQKLDSKTEFNGGDRPSPYLQFVATNKTGDTNMMTKTKMALAAALILGTASGALASKDGVDTGAVMPGSMDGVNPAYHPNWFPNYANGGKAYASVPSAKHAHRTSHHRTQN
jgi:hypothetical protein